MLREYAVDPAVAATWGDRRTGRYFIGSFGIGTSRILSNYPRKRWKKLVWRAWETDPAHRDGDRKRMEALIAQLSRGTARRPNAVWNPDSSWLQNAMAEHERAPFHAVLARHNPERHASVLAADDVDHDTELWADPPGTAARTAGDMDLHLLSRDQYEKRWSQYTRGSPAFDWSETPIRIDGAGAARE